jgi:hypothetical protein
MGWIEPTQERIDKLFWTRKWILWFHKRWEMFDHLNDYQLLKKDCCIDLFFCEWWYCYTFILCVKRYEISVAGCLLCKGAQFLF